MHGRLLSLGLLVVLVDDEADQERVHGDGVDGHEEHGDHVAQDADELGRMIVTMTW